MFPLIINYSCTLGASFILASASALRLSQLHARMMTKSGGDGDDAVQSVYTMENTMKEEEEEKGGDNGGN